MRRAAAAIVCGGAIALGGACAREPEQLPPHAEVKLVLDTDLDVARFGARLQIDLYDDGEAWFLSRELAREDPRVWPVSFVLVGPTEDDPGAAPRTVIARLRLYPDGKVRDYRGERWFPPGFLDGAAADACLPLLPPGYGAREAKELAQRGDDGEAIAPYAPQDEPIPSLAIDRLVPVRLVPGRQGEVRVRLEGRCLGVPASFGPTTAPGDEATCVGGALVAADVAEAAAASDAPSAVGSWPAARACAEEDRASAAAKDEVCLDGGLFLLGDPSVFAYGDYDGVPEHVAVMPPLAVDRHEVTVARFREAIASGAIAGAPAPIANDGPLDLAAADDRARCTFTSAPGDREDYPVTCVTFEAARAFCRAAGGDLPTEAEWEWAAAAAGRGGRETRFPWGSAEPSCERAVYARAADPARGATHCAKGPEDVGPRPVRADGPTAGDVTATGIVGLAGNVREITRDDYRPYCSRCWVEAPLDEPRCEVDAAAPRTVRGGSFASDEDGLYAGVRDEGLAPGAWAAHIGFRCVRPVPPRP